jgi:zinc and cadmium transporter
MISVYIYAISSVVLVSLISLIGLFTISLNKELLRKYVFVLISLAVGALLGDAFLHLIPEAFEKIADSTYVSIAIVGGILIFFIFEKVLHWHHHAHGEEHEETIHTNARMILVSDSVHNLIDGLIIGASYLVSIEVGIATTIAVMLHEIPQEIGDFGILIHSGYTRVKALWFNFLSASFAVIGAIIALSFGKVTDSLILWLLPIAAGGFIYVAMSDLLPELHKNNNTSQSLVQFLAILTGIVAMLLLLFLD